jgi:S-formylglutathione hydrolase FrmB
LIKWFAIIVVLGALAIAGVLHFRAGPRYTDTKRAQLVHYTLTSRLTNRDLHELGVIPVRHGSWLLVLLHGRGSPPAQFLSDPFFAELAKLGARAPVVVLLDGGDHSYWHDRADGRWASMVTREAIPDALRRFHTADKVAIGGISMGGYGALHIATLAPRQFCAVGGHSAALWTSAGATAPGAFDDAADYARNDVFASVGKLKGLPIWLDGGDRDPFHDADTAFAQAAHTTLHVWPGGHDQSYWNAHIAQYLEFYASNCS